MDITEVRVFPVTNEERLKAYATITIDNVFLIRDLRIINGNAGLFVAMPSRKMKDGTFKDIAHPLNSETRQMIESKVLAEYERELAQSGKAGAGAERERCCLANDRPERSRVLPILHLMREDRQQPILFIFTQPAEPGARTSPTIGDRLMVGQRPLKPLIGVRLPCPRTSMRKRGVGKTMVRARELKDLYR